MIPRFPLIDYGVKVRLVVDMVIGGCHGGTVEGYALSHDDSPDLLAVTLIAEPLRDEKGHVLPVDDVGQELLEDDSNPFSMSQSRWLWNEAHQPETLAALKDAWDEKKRARKQGAAEFRLVG
jgi:hypothetical protein